MKGLVIRVLTLIVLFSILMVACKTLKHIPSQSQLYGLDLRNYSEVNFLFTPEIYPGEYLTVGIIDYVFLPEANYLKDSKTGSSKWVVQDIRLEDAIDNVYKICIDMGADALIKFDISDTEKSYSSIANPIVIKGIRIKGLAIKRK